MTFRDEFRFIMALRDGTRVYFSVQDWDTGETPLCDSQVIEMANDLVRSGVEIHGSISGLSPNRPNVITILDPAEIVGVFMVSA